MLHPHILYVIQTWILGGSKVRLQTRLPERFLSPNIQSHLGIHEFSMPQQNTVWIQHSVIMQSVIRLASKTSTSSTTDCSVNKTSDIIQQFNLSILLPEKQKDQEMNM